MAASLGVLSPAQVARELQYLREKGLSIIGITKLERDLHAHRLLDHAVRLTFDDGYGDRFRYAFALRHLADAGIFCANEFETMATAGMSLGYHGTDHVDLSKPAAIVQSYQIGRRIGPLSGALCARTIRLERHPVPVRTARLRQQRAIHASATSITLTTLKDGRCAAALDRYPPDTATSPRRDTLGPWVR